MKFTIWYDKKEIKELKGSTKTFYFKTQDKAFIRGCNGMVTVYCLKPNGEPIRLGVVEYNTASYPGNYPCAVQLISKIFKYRGNNYSIKRKDILIYEMHG